MQRLFQLALISRGWPLWTRYSLSALLVAVSLFVVIGIIAAMLVETLHVAFVQPAESHTKIERAAQKQAILLRDAAPGSTFVVTFPARPL